MQWTYSATMIFLLPTRTESPLMHQPWMPLNKFILSSNRKAIKNRSVVSSFILLNEKHSHTFFLDNMCPFSQHLGPAASGTLNSMESQVIKPSTAMSSLLGIGRRSLSFTVPARASTRAVQHGSVHIYIRTVNIFTYAAFQEKSRPFPSRFWPRGERTSLLSPILRRQPIRCYVKSCIPELLPVVVCSR